MPKTLEFPLGLTSPLTAGPLVREAQRALSRNPFGDFRPGPVDGVFGEETGRAVKRAKHWLGYDDINEVYGRFLHAFLVGTVELPRDQLKRREQRVRQLQETPLRARALAEAIKHLGVRESPADSNRVLFSGWYGMIGPWCAMFTTWCYVKAGSVSHVRGKTYAYCPYIVDDARAGDNSLALTTDPQAGDLVLYDWRGDGRSDHVGLFEKWTLQRRGFVAVEGNTSPFNNSNGGQVMRRERNVGDVICFVHVGR